MIYIEDLTCSCGDKESEHVDAEAECVIIGCGCKEFQLPEEEVE